jgi:hypothetical protein
MGKAPRAAACLFCGELPCVCAKAARQAARVPRKKADAPKVVEAVVEAQPAPIAARRRFDATAAMKAAATPTGAATVPTAAPRIPAAPPLPIAAPLPRSAVQAQRQQIEPNSEIMDYAVHLATVMLGGVPVGTQAHSSLAIRAKRVRGRLHDNSLHEDSARPGHGPG